MSMNVNVFDWPYSKRYYLTHPWKWFGQLGRNLRAAWMRATKGWCYSDCWNFDDTFLTIVPEVLRYLADHGCGYPGSGKWDTPEKWSDWLHSVADLMEAAAADIDDANEFAEDFHRLSTNMKVEKKENGCISVSWPETDEFKEVKQLYFERMNELNEQRKESLRSAMKEFSEAIVEGVLWD